MLIFTIFFGLKTQSTDFSNAFAQADMPDDLNIYLEMPKNFGCSDGSDSVLFRLVLLGVVFVVYFV